MGQPYKLRKNFDDIDDRLKIDHYKKSYKMLFFVQRIQRKFITRYPIRGD